MPAIRQRKFYWFSYRNMEALGPVLIFVVLIAFYYVYLFLLHRMREGRYRRHSLGPEKTRFVTDYGSFLIEPGERTLYVKKAGGASLKFPFDKIDGIRYRAASEFDIGSEVIRGFDFWDFFPKWRDRYESYRICLSISDYGELTLFGAGKTRHREPIMLGIYIERAVSKLLGISRVENIEKYCRGIYQQMLKDFRSAGAELRVL